MKQFIIEWQRISDPGFLYFGPYVRNGGYWNPDRSKAIKFNYAEAIKFLMKKQFVNCKVVPLDLNDPIIVMI